MTTETRRADRETIVIRVTVVGEQRATVGKRGEAELGKARHRRIDQQIGPGLAKNAGKKLHDIFHSLLVVPAIEPRYEHPAIGEGRECNILDIQSAILRKPRNLSPSFPAIRRLSEPHSGFEVMRRKAKDPGSGGPAVRPETYRWKHPRPLQEVKGSAVFHDRIWRAPFFCREIEGGETQRDFVAGSIGPGQPHQTIAGSGQGSARDALVWLSWADR